jgi:serine/threonine-protein kinase RsbW
MIEEVKVARIHDFGGPESPTSATQPDHSVPFVELRYPLPSDVNIVSPFVNRLMPFISRFRGRDESNFEIELALSEALANAIIHGNHEDPDKQVYVWCRCSTDGEVSITIQDEGPGFDFDTVPDPTAAENLSRDSGRGIYLMKTLMDEVRFEQGGSVAHMRKWSNARFGAEGQAI